MKNSSDTTKFTTAIKDLLLEDYRYLSDSFWKNEQVGETRFNFFVGLFTLVVGALVTLATSNGLYIVDGQLFLVVIVALFSFLAFGVVTLLRILIRNERTDEIKRGLDHIRQRIKDYSYIDGVADGYYPLGSSVLPITEEPEEEVRKKWGQLRPRKFGGLAHSVATINSLVFTGLVVTFAVYASGGSEISQHLILLVSLVFLALLAFVAVMFSQVGYIQYRDNKHKKKIRESEFTHAGGVVFRQGDTGPEFLLVQAKDAPCEWVLPKGHIRREVGEGHGEAAMREVLEESGVTARVIAHVGSLVFAKDNESIRAKFYLMEHLWHGESEEQREIDWCLYEEALERLVFEESRRLLALAHIKLTRFL